MRYRSLPSMDREPARVASAHWVSYTHKLSTLTYKQKNPTLALNENWVNICVLF